MEEMLILRSPRGCAEYFKALDPETPINEKFIRDCLKDGHVSCVKHGVKQLVSPADILAYCKGQLEC